MESKKPNKPKGFKFNFYWIYAIIAVVFFGIQLMSVNTSSKEINWIVFEDHFQNQDVDKVVIINDKNIQVYIKNEALRKEKHISHFTLDEAVELSQEVGAESVYLTHISHNMGKHHIVNGNLPQHIKLAYDGLSIDF